MFGTYRTFLALMVVALHLGGIPAIGAYAVFGFYTLSGYLMTLIMQTNYGYTLSGITKYAINRFLRIYPIYWVSLIFSVSLIFFVGEEFSLKYHPAIYFPNNFGDILKNIFIFFPFREPPRLTPPSWALTIEIFYYILIALGLSKNKKIVAVWASVSLIYHTVIVFLGLDWDYRYFTIPAASLPFATGACIYHYKYEIQSFLSHLRVIGKYLPIIILVLILFNWYVGYILRDLKGLFFYSNFFFCAFMVIALSERKSLPFISRKFDKWMGDFSYPIYLFHYQVGLSVIALVSLYGVEMKSPSLLLMIFSIPVIFLVSWLTTVAIERPIELIRIKIKKITK